MKILQLCKKFPYPLNDGESIAVSYLSKGLSELGHTVDLLSMNTTKHYTDTSSLNGEVSYFNSIETVDVDNRVTVMGAAKNLFTSKAYHISRFESKEYRLKLEKKLQTNTYDIIQLETPVLSLYLDTIKKYSNAKVVLRAHNIEHEIWDRVASNESSYFKKQYLQICSKRLRAFEYKHLADFDALAAITSRDLESFKRMGFNKDGFVLPVGLDTKKYQKMKPIKESLTMSFIGSLDWMPNIHGLMWFLDNVWPIIHEQNPKIVFHIAGKNPSDRIKNIKLKNVVIHGEVDDAISFINQHDVMIVPLFSGSGMRVKILEGMALGKVVITTTIGAEGIEAESGEEILLANDKHQFTECVGKYLSDNNEIKRISKKARTLVENRYDYLFNAKTLANQYKSLISIRKLATKNEANINHVR